jgi:hypothetical protein
MHAFAACDGYACCWSVDTAFLDAHLCVVWLAALLVLLLVTASQT